MSRTVIEWLAVSLVVGFLIFFVTPHAWPCDPTVMDPACMPKEAVPGELSARPIDRLYLLLLGSGMAGVGLWKRRGLADAGGTEGHGGGI